MVKNGGRALWLLAVQLRLLPVRTVLVVTVSSVRLRFAFLWFFEKNVYEFFAHLNLSLLVQFVLFQLLLFVSQVELRLRRVK